VQTIPKLQLGRLIGYLLPDQEADLSEAIRSAFDLD
jgi:mRNA interferase MazF